MPIYDNNIANNVTFCLKVKNFKIIRLKRGKLSI